MLVLRFHQLAKTKLGLSGVPNLLILRGALASEELLTMIKPWQWFFLAIVVIVGLDDRKDPSFVVG